MGTDIIYTALFVRKFVIQFLAAFSVLKRHHLTERFTVPLFVWRPIDGTRGRKDRSSGEKQHHELIYI
jgi:hypothetical protein